MAKRDDAPDFRAPDFRAIRGMDPAANWLLGPAIDDYLEGVQDPERPVVPLLIEFGDEEAVRAFGRLSPLREGGRGNGFLVLGRAGRKVGAGSVVAVLTSPERLRTLLGDGEAARAFRDAPKRIVLSSPMDVPEEFLESYPDFPRSWDDMTVFATPTDFQPPETPWEPGTVVMGVVDDGIAFAHERLRSGETQTRVEAFWNMNLSAELSRPAIDAALAAASTTGVVDEDQVYRDTGLVDHTDPRHKAAAWRLAHGAHVLDLAAGEDLERGVRTRPVIAVQLPTPVVARTTGELLDHAVLLGVLYILDRARQISLPDQPLPVVINVSFGYTAGPHDGTGVLEQFVQTLIDSEPGVQFTFSAGNAQLSRCHAAIDLASQDVVEFDWMVQPNDRTHSLLQVRMPGFWAAGVDRMTMTVEPPVGGPLTISESIGPGDVLKDASGRVVGLLSHTLDWTPGGIRSVLNLWIRPTDRPQPHARSVAPAGRWKLTFTRNAGQSMAEAAHVWVQRDDSLFGYPQRGRQPYFDHADYMPFDANGRDLCDDVPPQPADCPIKRKSLFNAIATESGVITAGGYLDRHGGIASYSAGGPNTPAVGGAAPPGKPDALLPSDGSKAHRGILAAGARSGARVPMSGSSVAAPQLARFVADRIAAGLPADRAAVAHEAGMVVDPVTPPRLPLYRSAGRLPGVGPPVKRYEPGD